MEDEPEAQPDDRARRDPSSSVAETVAQTLAQQESDAAALRADLDALRRSLDEPRPAPAPAHKPRRNDRRRVLAAVLVGGSLAAAAVIVLVPWSDLGKSEPQTRPETSQLSQNAEPAQPVTAPADLLATSGPGIDQPGAAATVQVVPENGTLRIVEQAVLNSDGAAETRLQLPETRQLAGPAGTIRPGVSDLRVAVDGQPVAAIAASEGSGWDVRTAGARTIKVSYTLTDATVNSENSEPGRAVAVLLPLLGVSMQKAGLPYQLGVAGGGVSAVSCPGAAAAEMLCGLENATGWTAKIPADAASPVVLLQLNL